jgi:hypothetical protein
VKLAGEEAMALGLEEHVCRLSLHMDCLARLKVRAILGSAEKSCAASCNALRTESFRIVALRWTYIILLAQLFHLLLILLDTDGQKPMLRPCIAGSYQV